ncbi:hypothetical protein MTO96_017313 [Rhipicephalus appendiculatus]
MILRATGKLDDDVPANYGGGSMIDPSFTPAEEEEEGDVVAATFEKAPTRVPGDGGVFFFAPVPALEHTDYERRVLLFDLVVRVRYSLGRNPPRLALAATRSGSICRH